MTVHPRATIQLPPDQEVIRAKCFHPSGSFIRFAPAELEQAIPERFAQQVRRYPDRLAVKTKHQSLTYQALHRTANRLAHAILAQRGEGEEPIALLFDQDAALIAATLGVLEAGKFYVPLDPSQPLAGISYMLEDSQAKLIVCNTKSAALADALTQNACQVLNVDELASCLSTENPGVHCSPDALAFILYTSGSTGRPKGVVHTHRTVLHVTMKETNAFHLCPDDRLTLLYSPSVAGAVRNTFSAVLNGATVYPFNLKEEGLASLGPWLIQEGITIYNSVPTVFRHFASSLASAASFPKLRLIVLGSERTYKTDVDLYKQLFSHDCIFEVGFGCTEISRIREIFLDKASPITENLVPAGYPAEDTEILLLDEAGQAVDVTCIGEIAVKSRYLSPGYWRRPDLTRERFLPDPNGGDERIYLTGDLGRMRSDGCLEYLGRKDLQVKLRGYGIDVAAIEATLVDRETIKEAVVLVWENQPDKQRLVAYIVPAREPVPSVSALRHRLAETLPDYMIPSAFEVLDALPMLPTGKTDLRALPPPTNARPNLDIPFVSPHTPVEGKLAEIWAEVLGLDRIGIHDNFLDLGGHSLLATQIISRACQTFQVDVPPHALLEAPTVAEMAVIITDTQAHTVDEATMAQLLAEVEALTDEQAQQLVGDASQPRPTSETPT